jgi:hypothetical protein
MHEAGSKSTGSCEWYTPPSLFKALALTFDLDPCMPVGGLPWVPAAKSYDWTDDGLSQPWTGRVWLNPPYGPHTPKWLGRFLHHGDGVALVFARTSTRWAQTTLRGADAVPFLDGRVSFIASDGRKSGASGADSMLVARGAESVKALLASGLGVVMTTP